MKLDELKNFDQMRELAERNPEALESWRKKEIDSIINSAPDHLRKRLRGLQFQIDCKRQSQKTHLGACISISKMMHESVAKLNAVLNGKPSPIEDQEKDGKVLSFPALG